MSAPVTGQTPVRCDDGATPPSPHRSGRAASGHSPVDAGEFVPVDAERAAASAAAAHCCNTLRGLLLGGSGDQDAIRWMLNRSSFPDALLSTLPPGIIEQVVSTQLGQQAYVAQMFVEGLALHASPACAIAWRSAMDRRLGAPVVALSQALRPRNEADPASTVGVLVRDYGLIVTAARMEHAIGNGSITGDAIQQWRAALAREDNGTLYSLSGAAANSVVHEAQTEAAMQTAAPFLWQDARYLRVIQGTALVELLRPKNAAVWTEVLSSAAETAEARNAAEAARAFEARFAEGRHQDDPARVFDVEFPAGRLSSPTRIREFVGRTYAANPPVASLLIRHIAFHAAPRVVQQSWIDALRATQASSGSASAVPVK